jgi:hypothetical protein
MTARKDVSMNKQVMSQEYHQAHLAFSRAAIVEAAANRDPLLNLLYVYTADVVKAEQDRVAKLEREVA